MTKVSVAIARTVMETGYKVHAINKDINQIGEAIGACK